LVTGYVMSRIKKQQFAAELLFTAEIGKIQSAGQKCFAKLFNPNSSAVINFFLTPTGTTMTIIY
jgi:hypothetical protein